MIHRLPQHEIVKIKNSATVQEACMVMYQRKYVALQEAHGDKLPAVLQPWIDLMQTKIYGIPTENWSTAAHAVWVDWHYDSTVLIHCHAGIWYLSQNPGPEDEISPPLPGEVANGRRGILPR